MLAKSRANPSQQNHSQRAIVSLAHMAGAWLREVDWGLLMSKARLLALSYHASLRGSSQRVQQSSGRAQWGHEKTGDSSGVRRTDSQ